jgi:hypothetical protein
MSALITQATVGALVMWPYVGFSTLNAPRHTGPVMLTLHTRSRTRHIEPALHRHRDQRQAELREVA